MALTSLNSWIWACSNMEKTLEDPRWACFVAAALLRVPAFLLACNTRVGRGPPSHVLPQSAPRRTRARALFLSSDTTSLGPMPAP